MALNYYQVTITNFSGLTPCTGYYVLTGTTTDITSANYINGTSTLIPISSGGYTFDLLVDSSYDHIYVFVEHCDGYVTPPPSSTPKNQGGYQMSYVDLRCTTCV